MRSRKTAYVLAAFFAISIIGISRAEAQTQNVYPGDPYSNTNYGARPTYQYHYPAASSSTYPMQQFPAANVPSSATNQYPAVSSSAYPSNQYQPAQAAQPQYQPQQYQQPQYQTAQPAPQSYQPAPQSYQPAANGTAQQLPSYQYNQQLDPRYQPVYNPNGKAGSSSSSGIDRNYGVPYLSLETRPGLDLDATLAYYDYQEPGDGVNPTVKSNGAWFGFDALGTLTFGHGFFATADARYALGSLDYSGSGTASGDHTDSWEVRGLFGRDFIYQIFSLSPYAGVGYRTLYNDARGTTSTGASGYRRTNELYYLPIGIQPRTHIDSDARLTSSFEYDVLLRGLQFSQLSDAGGGDPDISNQQHSGYGLRGDIMYETRTWAIGPYFNYWHINDSHINWIQDNASGTCGGSPPCNPGFFEPANHTIEAGVKFKYHFF